MSAAIASNKWQGKNISSSILLQFQTKLYKLKISG